jgi:D-erythro-7,8-dihydroneopterin triphosphate epimerase
MEMFRRNALHISIENLRLRTIIGINDWERREKQDVVISVELELDGDTGTTRDAIEDTLDYKRLTKNIVEEVEQSHFFLLEKLCDHILRIAMGDTRVKAARVRVHKPLALRFADSVSVERSAERFE